MGRETPEDIFFGSYSSQIQPVAVDIFKFAYLSLFYQFLYLPDGGMEEEKVPYHQVYAIFFGKLLETSCFRCLECQGLFDEDVFFVGYNKLRYFEMGLGGCCHSEAIKVFLYGVPDGREGLCLRIFLLEYIARIGIGLNNTCQEAELVQGFDVIFPPATGADYRYREARW